MNHTERHPAVCAHQATNINAPTICVPQATISINAPYYLQATRPEENFQMMT
jgi:hypothetical protein